MNITIKTFFQFLARDYYRYKKDIKVYLINFSIIRPALYSISLAYIQVNVLFGSGQKELCTIFFIGNAMLIILILTFQLAFRLLFDLEYNKFVNYQITIIHPRLLLLQRIVFSTLFTFFVLLPFFPISKLILQSYLVTTNASWTKMFIVLFFGSLCLSCYNTLCSCIIKSSNNIASLWMRLNFPMMMLGGMWAPLSVVKSVAPWLTYLLYINPITYLTEGLRRAILGGDQFLPVTTCISALLALSILFTLLSFHFFKKRLDHI